MREIKIQPISEAVAEIGATEFKLRVEQSSPLDQAIRSDVEVMWPKWCELAEKQFGIGTGVAVSFGCLMISYGAGGLITSHGIDKDQFLKLD